MQVMAAPWMHLGWIVERAGLTPGVGFKAIEAVNEKGEIKGMVGYDGWTENSVVASIALDDPHALRYLLPHMFHYPFVQCGRGVIFCTIRETNSRSVRLTEHVGFRLLCRMKDAVLPGEDMLLYEMRREDCRWISTEYRKAA